MTVVMGQTLLFYTLHALFAKVGFLFICETKLSQLVESRSHFNIAYCNSDIGTGKKDSRNNISEAF